MRNVLLGLIIGLFFATSAFAVNTCGGYSSSGNPFPCCDNNGNGKTSDSIDGNCTWYAWKAAKDYWGQAPPVTGAPSKWISQAKTSSKFTSTTTPTKNAIAVGITASNPTHVAWVTSVSGSKITVNEMNCGGKYKSGKKSATYSASSFKYIKKK